MASKTFKATFMGQYRADNNTYVGQNSPIRSGGSAQYHSFLGFDRTAILSAMNTSSTTPRVFLNIYVTDSGSFDLGMHKETFDKKTDGLPFYRYARRAWTLSTGWKRQDITDISLSIDETAGFKNILNAGFYGPVLFGAAGSNQGVAYGVTNNQFHVYIEVTGTWNTAPGIPKITSPTSGVTIDKTFELKGTHASDNEQSSSGLRYEWAINDGTGWDYLGFGSFGVINRVVNFSSYAETAGGARVALRANDGELTGAWAYSPYFSIQHNKPPGQPTNLVPQGGTLLDRTNAITFSWQHNDADGQTAYDFRWRLQGATLWNETNVSTSSKSRVEAGGTFPLGTIEWQIRTYDQESLVGPYSNTALFSATEPTDAPTITSPTMSEVVAVSIVNVSWSTVDQEEYELELSKDGIILWSETVISTIRVREVQETLENDSTYKIRSRVRLLTEIFSSWAEVTFTTSFTQPSEPLVELFEWREEAAVDIRINNQFLNLVGEPTVLSNDIFRREFGTDDPFIRIATNVSNNGVFRDYTPASGINYEYFVRAFGDNGTIKDSIGYSIAILIEDTLLGIAANPAFFVKLRLNPNRSLTHNNQRTLMKFNGRVFPVAEYGVHEDLKYSSSFTIPDRVTLLVMRSIIESKETMLFRDSRGRREFITINELNVQDRYPDGYDVSFDIDVVEFIEEV